MSNILKTIAKKFHLALLKELLEREVQLVLTTEWTRSAIVLLTLLDAMPKKVSLIDLRLREPSV